MATLQLSLSDEAAAYIDQQVRSGLFRSRDEFIGSLILAAQHREAQAKLESALLEGLDSGPAIEFSRKEWEEIRQTVHERVKRRKGA